MAVEMEFLRISDVGEGYGPCNAFDGDELCGEEAVWVAAEGARQAPGAEEWEPFRFCVKHWRREVREQAERDRAEAFLRDHGYPDGYGLATLVYITGSYISTEGRVIAPEEVKEVKRCRHDATMWLRNWIAAHRDELELVERAVTSFDSWIRNPQHKDPLVKALLDSADKPLTAKFILEVRQGIKLGIPVARKIIRILAGM